jgi:hypothetical protein
VQRSVVENGIAGWRDLVVDRVVDVNLPGFGRTNLVLVFPEHRVAQLRVTIENGDNPPLTDLKLAGAGPMRQVIWLAEPGRAYRLLYGGENFPAPVYDLDAVLAPVRQGLIPAVRVLGPPRENAAYQPARAGLRG